jgi:hypothetical protein
MYTTIKPGGNRITAKYECANDPSTNLFSSVNVTGVQASTSNSSSNTSTGGGAAATNNAVSAVHRLLFARKYIYEKNYNE